jgi:hypothetical protein
LYSNKELLAGSEKTPFGIWKYKCKRKASGMSNSMETSKFNFEYGGHTILLFNDAFTDENTIFLENDENPIYVKISAHFSSQIPESSPLVNLYLKEMKL